MYEYNGKIYRSLEEQVQKNMDDIEELMEGGVQSAGWSTEAIDMFENLLHQIIYKDATTGQNMADALIAILRSTKTLTSITATDNYPEKKRYVGADVDPSEFTVTANYSDGKTEELENFTIYPATYQEDGKVYFSYRGFDAVVTVPIFVDPVVDWAIVDYEPKQMRMNSTVSETLTSVRYKLIYASGAETTEDDMNNLSFSPDTVYGLQNTINVSINGTELPAKPILIVGTSTPVYSVSYSAENANVSVYNGSTRVESGSYVAEGTSLTVNAVADSGYRISSIKLNGAEITVPHTWTVNANATIVVSTELAPSTEVTYTGRVKRGGTTTGVVSISGEGTFTETPSFIKLVCDEANPGSKLSYALIKREGDTWYVKDAKYGTGTVTINVGVDTADVEFAGDYSEVTVSKIQGTVVGTYKPDGLGMVSTQYYTITVANHELEV